MRLFPVIIAMLVSGIVQSRVDAAEQPLGVLEQISAHGIDVHFDASVQLAPGMMLAVYGPGTVEKHPLTHEVLIEHRKLVAKIQVVAMGDGVAHTRMTWGNAATLLPGFDVVPLPNEAAPNSPPALTAGVPAFSAQVEGTVRITVPISDPDGDAVNFTWSLNGSGDVGTLSARVTTQPEVLWTAPGKPGQMSLHVLARDPFGQQCEATIPLGAYALEDVRKREMKAFAVVGGEHQPSLARLSRDGDGAWWCLDDANHQVHRVAAGWMSELPFSPSQDSQPKRPLAVRVWHRQVHVLDGKTQQIERFSLTGDPMGSIGQFVGASDFLMTADGTLFVADQEGGGVAVYEATGGYRSRLGRVHAGEDGFVGLTRLAMGRAGELYCLDSAQGQIQRFDRFQHRLDTWKLQLDGKRQAVDLAVQAKGLLVLLSSGEILQVDGKGMASQAWKSLADSQLVDRAGDATSLMVDADNEVYVTYTDNGFLARYNADGVLTGVRGGSLWDYRQYAADGQGRLFALDSDAGFINVSDGEGFRTARLGGFAKNGGPFSKPIAVAVSPNGQSLCVLDADLKAVIRFNLANPAEKPMQFGQPGKNGGQFDEPCDLAMDGAGRCYVLDDDLHRVSVFDPRGSFLFHFGHYDRGKQIDELSEPTKIAVNLDGSACYVYDDDSYEIKKFALDFVKNTGTHVNNSGGKGDDPGQFRSVQGMGCDRLGLLYVGDGKREDLQVLDFRGSNAIATQHYTQQDLGIRRIQNVAVAPDGQVFLFYDGIGMGWHW